MAPKSPLESGITWFATTPEERGKTRPPSKGGYEVTDRANVRFPMCGISRAGHRRLKSRAGGDQNHGLLKRWVKSGAWRKKNGGRISHLHSQWGVRQNGIWDPTLRNGPGLASRARVLGCRPVELGLSAGKLS